MHGIDALEQLGKWNHDAVILDVLMPGLDGFSVLKQCRANGSQRLC